MDDRWDLDGTSSMSLRAEDVSSYLINTRMVRHKQKICNHDRHLTLLWYGIEIIVKVPRSVLLSVQISTTSPGK